MCSIPNLKNSCKENFNNYRTVSILLKSNLSDRKQYLKANVGEADAKLIHVVCLRDQF